MVASQILALTHEQAAQLIKIVAGICMARLPEVALSQNPSGAGPFISSRSVQWVTSCPLLFSRGALSAPGAAPFITI